jgi:tRNA (uracil-5-)-methyltransferase
MPRDVEKFFAEVAPQFEVKRVRPTSNAVVVKMVDQQTRDKAIAELSAMNLTYKHFSLTFSRAWTVRERLEKRSGKRKLEDSAPRKLRTVEEAVTPLHATPYEEQLVIKARAMRVLLRKFATRLIRQNFGGAWLSTVSAKAMSGGCCPQAPIVRAELVEGYRNKCEFAIGRDEDKQPCVGFMRGTFVDGGAVVGNPAACRNVSAEMKAVVAALQEFVSASPHAVYDGSGNNSGVGFWRMLLVRQTRKSELLVSIQVRPPCPPARIPPTPAAVASPREHKEMLCAITPRTIARLTHSLAIRRHASSSLLCPSSHVTSHVAR